MLVMKFGGSSLATAARLHQVADLVMSAAKTPCVVLSAMGDATNQLFAIAKVAGAGNSSEAQRLVAKLFDDAQATIDELLQDPSAIEKPFLQLRADVEMLIRGIARGADQAPSAERTARTTDALVAHGERIATLLLTTLLQERGHPVIAVDARDVMCTNNMYGRAKPMRGQIQQRSHQNIGVHIAHGITVVTQGYVGSAPDGSTTTLGRGGSDWSASLLCAALGGEELQIWTDVEGVLTADPRTVAAALPIAHLTPEEAAELAAFGARVLHPSTIQPVVDKGIPVTVRHTMRPHGLFTRIDRAPTDEARGIAALASRGPITVLTMTSRRMLDASGYLARLFEAFGELDIPVDLVTTAEVSVACTVEADAPIEKLMLSLEGHAHVEVLTDCAIVAAIGDGLQHTDRVLERACRALYPIKPQMVSFGGNSRNLSFVVRCTEQDEALQRLHDTFFCDRIASTATVVTEDSI
jgi:aspartate kinase